VKRKWFIVLAGILLFFGLCSTVSRLRAPSYEGRPVTYWLKEVGSQSERDASTATKAIREIGTNALPVLLTLSRSKGGPDALIQHLARIWPSIGSHTAEERRELAIDGFRSLGSMAEPVVPGLISNLSDPELAMTAEQALAQIGGPAVNQMCQAMTNNDENVRYNLANALSLLPLRESATGAVPTLLHHLHDPSWRVRGQVADSLGTIGAAAEEVVPALVAMLNDQDYYPRTWSMIALGQFGAQAGAAVPALSNAVSKGKSNSERSIALRALKQIDPEAARKISTDDDDGVRP